MLRASECASALRRAEIKAAEQRQYQRAGELAQAASKLEAVMEELSGKRRAEEEAVQSKNYTSAGRFLAEAQALDETFAAMVEELRIRFAAELALGHQKAAPKPTPGLFGDEPSAAAAPAKKPAGSSSGGGGGGGGLFGDEPPAAKAKAPAKKSGGGGGGLSGDDPGGGGGLFGDERPSQCKGIRQPLLSAASGAAATSDLFPDERPVMAVPAQLLPTPTPPEIVDTTTSQHPIPSESILAPMDLNTWPEHGIWCTECLFMYSACTLGLCCKVPGVAGWSPCVKEFAFADLQGELVRTSSLSDAEAAVVQAIFHEGMQQHVLLDTTERYATLNGCCFAQPQSMTPCCWHMSFGLLCCSPLATLAALRIWHSSEMSGLIREYNSIPRSCQRHEESQGRSLWAHCKGYGLKAPYHTAAMKATMAQLEKKLNAAFPNRKFTVTFIPETVHHGDMVCKCCGGECETWKYLESCSFKVSISMTGMSEAPVPAQMAERR